jgi:glycosyltransferase involved in cell wall biosynthesis
MKTIYIVVTDFNEDLSRRQPWYTINAMQLELKKNGFEPQIVSSYKNIPTTYVGYVLKVWGIKDLIFRSSRFKLIYLVTFPIYESNILRRLSYEVIKNNLSGLYRILLVSLIPLTIIGINLKRAKRVITISDRSYNYLSRIVNCTRYYPYICNNWGDRDLNTFNKDDKVTNIGYFGPPISSRGIDNVVGFMSKSIQNRMNYKYTILSRLERNDLKEKELIYIHSLLDDCQVTIHSGFMEREQLYDELKHIDILIMPFKIVLSELPIVVLEAIELGLGLITTNHSGIEILCQELNVKNVHIIDENRISDYSYVNELINEANQKCDRDMFYKYLKSVNLSIIETLGKE